jgi:hypothetical protein
MYSYTIKEDSRGIYYTLSWEGQEFYIHRFSFDSKEQAAGYAFDHILLKLSYFPIMGAPDYFFNGRRDYVSC